MKKLLAIFAATGMVATSGMSIVACNGVTKVEDKDGFLKTNPSTTEEVIYLLNNLPTMLNRRYDLWLKIEESEINDIFIKMNEEGISSLTDTEKSTMASNEDWNQYAQDTFVRLYAEYKIYQYYLSLSSEDANKFLTDNEESIDGLWGSSFVISVENYSENEEEMLNNLSLDEVKGIVNSNSEAIIKKAIDFVKDNKFKKS